MISSLLFASVPWLSLVLLLQKIIPTKRPDSSSWFSLALAAVTATVVLLFPIGGFSLLRWSASFVASFSLPLVGILIILLLEQMFSRPIFLPQDWHATWIFGATASLLLYPSACGLTSLDTYSWGWGSGPLLLALALVIGFLLWKKNSFGILLLLTLTAFDCHAQESTNLWDYLMDPIYAGMAILMTLQP